MTSRSECRRDSSNNGSATSYHALNSQKLADQLHNQINGARRLIPTYKTIEKKIRPEDITGNMNQPQDVPRAPLRGITSNSQEIHHAMEPRINHQVSEQQSSTPGILVGISIKPRNKGEEPTLKGVTKQTSPSALSRLLKRIKQATHLFYNDQCPSLVHRLDAQRPTQSNHQHSQQQSSSPGILVGISIKPTNEGQESTLHGVTKQTSPPASSRLSKTIKQATNLFNNNKRPGFVRRLDTQGPTQPNRQDPQQQSRTPKIRVGISIKHLNIKGQDSTLKGVTKQTSPTALSRLLKTIKQATYLFYKDLQNEQQLERKTFRDISVTTSRYMHNSEILTCSRYISPRIQFTTIYKDLPQNRCNQLTDQSSGTSSTMRVNFGENVVRSSAAKYTSKAMENAFQADYCINVEPVSSDGQCRNDVVNKPPNSIWRFVLPPQYDPNDSKWTLKYREILPGLVELMPQSNIYVSYGDLKYAQIVSKDCKSLARRLLPAVFNRIALSVCSTMTEKAKAVMWAYNLGSKVRPRLDEHATITLLNFVREHGLQCGWNTDEEPINSALNSKIQILRFKYAAMAKC